MKKRDLANTENRKSQTNATRATRHAVLAKFRPHF
jgi:hypothetical protein